MANTVSAYFCHKTLVRDSCSPFVRLARYLAHQERMAGRKEQQEGEARVFVVVQRTSALIAGASAAAECTEAEIVIAQEACHILLGIREWRALAGRKVHLEARRRMRVSAASVAAPSEDAAAPGEASHGKEPVLGRDVVL